MNSPYMPLVDGSRNNYECKKPEGKRGTYCMIPFLKFEQMQTNLKPPEWLHVEEDEGGKAGSGL